MKGYRQDLLYPKLPLSITHCDTLSIHFDIKDTAKIYYTQFCRLSITHLRYPYHVHFDIKGYRQGLLIPAKLGIINLGGIL